MGSAVVFVVLLALIAAASAQARPHACGTLAAAGGDVLRVWVVRGVTCSTAMRVARHVAQARPPVPWRCLTGTGQTFRGKPVSFACGHPAHGPVLRRRHAFVAVQQHVAG